MNFSELLDKGIRIVILRFYSLIFISGTNQHNLARAAIPNLNLIKIQFGEISTPTT